MFYHFGNKEALFETVLKSLRPAAQRLQTAHQPLAHFKTSFIE